MEQIVLETVEDYDRAIALIQKLSGSPKGSEQDAALDLLIEAAEAWMRQRLKGANDNGPHSTSR